MVLEDEQLDALAALSDDDDEKLMSPLNSDTENGNNNGQQQEAKTKSGKPKSPVEEMIDKAKSKVIVGLTAAGQASKQLIQKCKGSHAYRVAYQKLSESQIARTIYEKLKASKLAEYAQKEHATNPTKAKQKLATVVIVFVILCRVIFFSGGPGKHFPSQSIYTKDGDLLPNVLFVGPPNSGVEAVTEWLGHNTNICTPAINLQGQYETKGGAVGYFNRPGPKKEGLNWYTKRWKHCGDDHPMVMDPSPLYMHVPRPIHDFYSKHAVHKHATTKHLKIVIILREPTELAYLEYTHNSYHTKKTFDQYVNDIGAHCLLGQKPPNKKENCQIPSFVHQATYMNMWLKWFDRSQILVLSFDELETKPENALRRLEIFLGYDIHKKGVTKLLLPTSAKASISGDGSTIQPQNMPTCEGQSVLQTIMEDYNEELYDLLKKHKKRQPHIEQVPFPKYELGPCRSE